MATSRTTSMRGARRLRRLVSAAAATIVLLAAWPQGATGASTYSWPVQPFDRQHPVRGFFGDPRVGDTPHGEAKSFHFGIDISAPDGTPVYATLTGRIVLESVRPETVSIIGDSDASLVFAYWHIVPSVRNGQHAVAYRTVLGHISKGWEHVHFAELHGGRYVNPLRRGALAPYADHTAPTIHTFSFERNGIAIGKHVHGSVDLVAEAWDDVPLAVSGRWHGKPVMPALVRWRVTGGDGYRTPWRVVADFRTTIPKAGSYDRIYARWTRQNHPWRSGRYRIRLAAGWRSSSVPDGRYRLEVAAEDTRGNRTQRAVEFTVANRRRP